MRGEGADEEKTYCMASKMTPEELDRKLTRKIFKLIATAKIYFDRSGTYIGYVQFMMLVLVTMKEFNIKVNILRGILATFAVIVLRVIIGYIDKKLILPHELKRSTELNPWMLELDRKITELYEKNRN